jgi:hypothetical protein
MTKIFREFHAAVTFLWYFLLVEAKESTYCKIKTQIFRLIADRIINNEKQNHSFFVFAVFNLNPGLFPGE